jgi:hypothetical protein
MKIEKDNNGRTSSNIDGHIITYDPKTGSYIIELDGKNYSKIIISSDLLDKLYNYSWENNE